jgi:capsular polysaccharide biosynthesis protein
MSNSRTKNVVRIVIILACMFFGACAGVSWSALQITGKPQVFRSLAKILASGSTVATEDPQWREQLQDFYGTIIETLESAEMNRKARERVHALHPDLKDSDVEIRVTQTKGSGIINILATGSEPVYSQIFLNALLDELMNFRQAIREKAQKDGLDVAILERATTAMERNTDWMMTIILGGVGGAVLGLVIGLLVSLLTSLLGQPKAPQA